MFSISIQHTLGDFSLDARFESAADTGVTALSGASGAGKSSVLRCIAGLACPTAGHIEVGGRVLFDSVRGINLPVHKRQIGVVFQDSRLFPHMSVLRNLRYGMPKDRPELVHFDDVVGLLGIGGLLERRPRALSGGERQRVAIGRALLTSPSLLLMDEPLASLDQARKDEVLPFLAALPRRFALPIVYVTHSMDELLQLADNLVVMADGRVVASGPVAETASGVGALGVDTVLEGKVLSTDTHGTCLGLGPHRIYTLPLVGLDDGQRIRVRVPGDDVMLATGPTTGLSVRNQLRGTVVSVESTARGSLVTLRLDGVPDGILKARVSEAAAQELNLGAGKAVVALIKAASVRVPGLVRR